MNHYQTHLRFYWGKHFDQVSWVSDWKCGLWSLHKVKSWQRMTAARHYWITKAHSEDSGELTSQTWTLISKIFDTAMTLNFDLVTGFLCFYFEIHSLLKIVSDMTRMLPSKSIFDIAMTLTIIYNTLCWCYYRLSKIILKLWNRRKCCLHKDMD